MFELGRSNLAVHIAAAVVLDDADVILEATVVLDKTASYWAV